MQSLVLRFLCHSVGCILDVIALGNFSRYDLFDEKESCIKKFFINRQQHFLDLELGVLHINKFSPASWKHSFQVSHKKRSLCWVRRTRKH